MLQYRRIFLKKAPHLNKNSHRLPNVTRRILRNKQRILWSPMPNEHPEHFYSLPATVVPVLVKIDKGKERKKIHVGMQSPFLGRFS